MMRPWYLPNVDERHIQSLDPGLRLFRVHPSEKTWADANSKKPHLRIGGRFDCHAGDPAAWYVSTTRQGAFSEALFRDDGLGGDDPPVVPLGDLKGLSTSEVEITKEVAVLALEGSAFQLMRIPPSVAVTLNRHDYAISRQAAEDIRASVEIGTTGSSFVRGLRWSCARNTRLTSLVLWLDDGGRWLRLMDHVASVEVVPVLDDLALIEGLASDYGYEVVT